jgi:hypothetical protein
VLLSAIVLAQPTPERLFLFPAIARGFAKDNLMKTTKEALSKRAQAVE